MSAPTPLLANGKPVDWWFAFKFNAATFTGDETKEPNPGIFGGQPLNYNGGFCLNYACASSASPTLALGNGYIGTSINDPLGATFNQVYNGALNYVLWNDQFYNDPLPTMDSPWGHSKGALAWDDSGAGFVLQVSTPSWPASGSSKHPRAADGNTLGCIHDDDVMVSQHFFALKLSPADVAVVLAGLANASIVTKVGNPQIFNAGGPPNLVALAQKLGVESSSATLMNKPLSTAGVTFISKPSALHAPPWQLVSSQLNGLPLRVASWWADPTIPSTSPTTAIACWNGAPKPGAVQIAISGTWQKETIGLTGGKGKAFNHGKVGISMQATQPLCIFGDLNQQGTIGGNGDPAGCASSQNGRGGTFYVLKEPTLFQGLTSLLQGSSAPTRP